MITITMKMSWWQWLYWSQMTLWQSKVLRATCRAWSSVQTGSCSGDLHVMQWTLHVGELVCSEHVVCCTAIAQFHVCIVLVHKRTSWNVGIMSATAGICNKPFDLKFESIARCCCFVQSRTRDAAWTASASRRASHVCSFARFNRMSVSWTWC